MVLEVPFPSAAPRLWDGVSSILTAENLQKYECEGVSVRKLSTLASRPKKGALKIAVELMLMNRPGHDKLVVVAMQVFSDDVAIGANSETLCSSSSVLTERRRIADQGCGVQQTRDSRSRLR